MSKDEAMSAAIQLFKNFDSDLKKLEKIPETTEIKTKGLLKLLYEEDIFDAPWNFVNLIDDLADELGQALLVVLLIELARERISPQKAKDFMASFQDLYSQKTGQPLVIQPSAPTNISWLGAYFYSKAVRDAAKATVQATNQPLPAGITTEKEVVDILQSGKQLIPHFNLLREVFETDLIIIGTCGFDDKATRTNLKSEIRLFLTNLIGVIRPFSRCASEYRKELVFDRKQEIGKFVMALETLRVASQQEMPFDRMSKLLTKR